MSSICLQRPYTGIGDWLMALTCLKFVNRQRPDTDIFVDFTSTRAMAPIIQQAYDASDVTFRPGIGVPETIHTTDSLVYRNLPPENYIESMVLHLNRQTNLGIEYEHHVFPDFGFTRRQNSYIVMVGQGKRRDRHRKEWGCQNLARLAHILIDAGHDVRQIGGKWDKQILGCSRFLRGEQFVNVAHELAGARAFIGLENGMMMLAGFLGVPQATIYDGHSLPGRTDFDNHKKFAGRIEPEAVARELLQWLDNL